MTIWLFTLYGAGIGGLGGGIAGAVFHLLGSRDNGAVTSQPKELAPAQVKSDTPKTESEVKKKKSSKSPSPALPLIQQLTNGELRDKVFAFSTGLRNFEDSHTREMQDFESQQPVLKGDDEESKRIWNWQIQRRMNRQAEYQAEYNKRYLTDAQIYRNELIRRTNIMQPYDEKTITALEGTLAGPYPVQRLAGYLEWLAKQLPE